MGQLTFSNATVLPLAAKVAGALGAWLAPAFGGEASRLRLWFDADQVEALSGDREALWSRIAAADFLTVDEKRAAVGYGPAEADIVGPRGWKYRADQPRVPRGVSSPV